jgi:N-acetylneuraminic acid mutarotase
MYKSLSIYALLLSFAMTVSIQEKLVWVERATLPQPRAGYIAGVIDGRYVVAGGSFWEKDQKIWTARVDAFDPRTNTWSEASSLPEPRSDSACATLGGNLYVFGGQDRAGAKSDALVLKHGKWRPLPEATLPESRLYASAVVSANSIYIAGGMSKTRDPKSVRNSFWRWNTRASKQGWEILPAIPGPGLINLAAAAIHQKIYVFGGANAGGQDYVNSNRAFEFDIRTQRWTQLPGLPIARRCWSAVSLEDTVLLIGGYTEVYEKEVFEYDPVLHSLGLMSELPSGVCDAKFLRIGDYVVGAGGESGDRIRGPWMFESRLPSRRSKDTAQ